LAIQAAVKGFLMGFREPASRYIMTIRLVAAIVGALACGFLFIYGEGDWLRGAICLLLVIFLIFLPKLIRRLLGTRMPPYACPCCGFRTLDELAGRDICPVCWWEDDGQDGPEADKVLGGPNSDLSLTQARANFIKHGISNPRRTDLKPDNPDKYKRGRRFVLGPDGTVKEISSLH
jgi:hypothetical protein